jgi:hypothetical protein
MMLTLVLATRAKMTERSKKEERKNTHVMLNTSNGSFYLFVRFSQEHFEQKKGFK